MTVSRPVPPPIDRWMNPVLGYAARDVTDAARAAWDEERRALGLVRSDAALILSVDVTSWPSVLSDEQQVIVASPGDLELQDLCPNLEKLREGLTSIWCRERPPPCWIVAVNVLTANWGEPERAAWAHPHWVYYFSEVVPTKLDPSWSCLGYDVADDGLFSSMTTMGGDRHEIPRIRREWSRHLNCYNLFEDPRSAWEYKLFSDRWIKEHAPFFVYGLWQVQVHEAI